jgi:hypothetical protein
MGNFFESHHLEEKNGGQIMTWSPIIKGFGDEEWTELDQDWIQWQVLVLAVLKLLVQIPENWLSKGKG